MTAIHSRRARQHGRARCAGDALWGAQTQRAIQNFPASGLRMPRAFIRALGLIKQAAAAANADLGDLAPAIAAAIQAAALEVAPGRYDDQFPVDVFQTGSGTSSNMNANEVIAALAARSLGQPVHPNDHVNMSQSSNDVVPTAIHVAAALLLTRICCRRCARLSAVLERRGRREFAACRQNRPHALDGCDADHGCTGIRRLAGANRQRLRAAAVGHAAAARARAGRHRGGHGHQCQSRNSARVFARHLAARHRHRVSHPAHNYFEALSSQDTAVELSGQLKVVERQPHEDRQRFALDEQRPARRAWRRLRLPALQPGSSIMPGKVNPVVPESVTMIAAQVIGNDSTITIGGQSGNFQLNVMLPVIAYNLLQSLELLGIAQPQPGRSCARRIHREHAAAARGARRAIPSWSRRSIRCIGYEKGAAIAKKAYAEGRPILEVAAEMTDLSER